MTVATKSALLAAVEKTAFRASLLMRATTHPDRTAIGTWSVAETANHLSHCYPSFIDAFQGTFSVAAEDVDEHNAEVLAADPERDLDVLADRVEAGSREYLEVAGAFDEVIWSISSRGCSSPRPLSRARCSVRPSSTATTLRKPKGCRGRSNRSTPS